MARNKQTSRTASMLPWLTCSVVPDSCRQNPSLPAVPRPTSDQVHLHGTSCTPSHTAHSRKFSLPLKFCIVELTTSRKWTSVSSNYSPKQKSLSSVLSTGSVSYNSQHFEMGIRNMLWTDCDYNCWIVIVVTHMGIHKMYRVDQRR